MEDQQQDNSQSVRHESAKAVTKGPEESCSLTLESVDPILGEFLSLEKQSGPVGSAIISRFSVDKMADALAAHLGAKCEVVRLMAQVRGHSCRSKLHSQITSLCLDSLSEFLKGRDEDMEKLTQVFERWCKIVECTEDVEVKARLSAVLDARIEVAFKESGKEFDAFLDFIKEFKGKIDRLLVY